MSGRKDSLVPLQTPLLTLFLPFRFPLPRLSTVNSCYLLLLYSAIKTGPCPGQIFRQRSLTWPYATQPVARGLTRQNFLAFNDPSPWSVPQTSLAFNDCTGQTKVRVKRPFFFFLNETDFYQKSVCLFMRHIHIRYICTPCGMAIMHNYTEGPMRLGDNLRDTKPPPSLRQWTALLFHSLD